MHHAAIDMQACRPADVQTLPRASLHQPEHEHEPEPEPELEPEPETGCQLSPDFSPEYAQMPNVDPRGRTRTGRASLEPARDTPFLQNPPTTTKEQWLLSLVSRDIALR